MLEVNKMSSTAPIRVILALLVGTLTTGLLVAGPSGIASATTPPPAPNCGEADGSHFPGATSNPKGTGAGAAYGEIAADTCYTRSGNTATVSFSWGSIGKLYDGIFYYQLVNCTTGAVAASMSRTLQYPNGTSADGGSAKATWALQAGVKYKPRATGEGEYDRASAASTAQGVIGYFARGDTPSFIGDGYCK
jgi:hypothetical protein